MKKRPWQSRTLWGNLIGIAAIIFGPDVIDPEAEAALLGIVNMILRIVTSSGISLSGDGSA